MNSPWPIPSNLNVLNIDGYPFTYMDRGSGPPLILIHGALVDARVWNNVMDPFATRYRVIAPNLRHYYPEPWKGHGGSFSAERHAEDLAALVKALNLEKVHWLGWSRGGLVMVEVAKRHPDMVRTLIFEDGNIKLPVEETEETREAVTFSQRLWDTLQQNIRGGDLGHAAEVFCDALNGKGYWSRLPSAARQMMLQNIYTTLGEVRMPLTTPDQVRCFNSPVLLLTGERSPKRYGFYYDEMRKYRDFSATVVIPNAAHAIHLDNPEHFLSVIFDFLAKH